MDTRTHDFDVDALRVRGEMWLGCVGGMTHLRPGDRFMLARQMPHDERYGAEGAAYWVARRNPRAWACRSARLQGTRARGRRGARAAAHGGTADLRRRRCRRLRAALEGWVRSQGASHLRLGVVQGHERAERFWAGQGCHELRRREGVDTGGRVNTVRVMLKTLADEDVEAYLQAMPRDQPGSPLP